MNPSSPDDGGGGCATASATSSLPDDEQGGGGGGDAPPHPPDLPNCVSNNDEEGNASDHRTPPRKEQQRQQQLGSVATDEADAEGEAEGDAHEAADDVDEPASKRLKTDDNDEGTPALLPPPPIGTNANTTPGPGEHGRDDAKGSRGSNLDGGPASVSPLAPQQAGDTSPAAAATEEGDAAAATEEGDGAPTKEDDGTEEADAVEVEEDGDAPEDMEVQVVSPPPPPRGNDNDASQPYTSLFSANSALHSQAASSAAASNGDDDNDGNDDEDGEDGCEITIERSNLTNATVSFPHPRYQCGVNPFRKDGPDDLNERTCPKCYCYVCDVPAGECKEWTTAGGQHCNAHSADPRWYGIRRAAMDARRRREAAAAAAAGGGSANEIIVLDDDESNSSSNAAGTAPSSRQQRRQRVAAAAAAESSQRQKMERMRVMAAGMASMGGAGGGMMGVPVPKSEIHSLINDELQGRWRGEADRNGGRSPTEGTERSVRARKDMSVRDVLSDNFRRVLALSSNGESTYSGESSAAAAASSGGGSNTTATTKKMEGDIPQLGLHNSFFVEGIKVGWPFPVVMPPQRQMAIHLIKALKNSRHVVLESPTGTGKSAAILCSALAWQRYHAKRSNGGSAPKIIYCSRTHSQVAQMVASLKKTPYRPKMAILGSRERMCIHRDLKPRAGASAGGEQASAAAKGANNVNHECRVRVRNTEKYRKSMWRSMSGPTYDDDDPPLERPGDRGGTTDAAGGGDAPDNGGEDGEGGDGGYQSRNFKTCPHYRQLTTNRIAALAHSMFTPNRVDCCSLGGEKTKLGAHDIEDLVKFGVNPHVLSGVAVYRDGSSPSIGLQLTESKGGNDSVVKEVKRGTAAEKEGTLRRGDRIVGLNGQDVGELGLSRVANEIRKSTQDPVVFDVTRGNDEPVDDDGYSPHAACPYYLSQVLSKHAELVFAPYNYILDPGIRNALDITLEGSVVVLDEAHNVEDTLRDSGSGKYGEIELAELMLMLNNYSTMEKSNVNLINVADGDASNSNGDEGTEGQMYVGDVAHEILLFLERLIDFLRGNKDRFEKSPGKKGAAEVIKEYRKYHTPDDREFEVSFDGPTGRGQGNVPVGCRTFFDKLQLVPKDLDSLVRYAAALVEHVRGNQQEEEQRSANQMDRLLDLIGKFTNACQKPEHFYIASVVSANGSLAFAAGDEDSGEDSNATRANSRFKKKPKRMPFVPPRTQAHPDRPPNPCPHQCCREKSQGNAFNVIRHGAYCDGSTPKWEASLVLNLLTPGLPMMELSKECRTVVLASGSLAPLPSLCGELNLLPPKETSGPSTNNAAQNSDDDPNNTDRYGRLQVHPRPLEANHVVNLPKQLLAVSIGHFPDGTPLTVTYSNYNKPDFVPKLGHAIATVIEGIPMGGVLVFLPSYSFLRKCVNSWNPSFSRSRFSRFGSQDEDVWDRILSSKGKIIVETTGSQEKFEAARNEYNETVRNTGSCVLLAVYRGKMSEGVSFNDDYARGVICVGIPNPNSYDMSIRAKKDYNDEQRRLRNRTNLLPGNEWYSQQAYRAIAQALGRCIRHAADYGTIVLLDNRHCDDGAPCIDDSGVCRAHRNLPKWMRQHVKNLSMHGQTGGRMQMYLSSNPGSKEIHGGWLGLAQEMRRFFREAKPHVESVLAKQQADLRKAQERDQKCKGRSFDSKTGRWSSSPTPKTSSSSSSAAVRAAGNSSAAVQDAGTLPKAQRPPEIKLSANTPAPAGMCSATFQSPVGNQVDKTATSTRATTSTSRDRIRRAMQPKKPANTLQAMFERQNARVVDSKPAPVDTAQKPEESVQGHPKPVTASSPITIHNDSSSPTACKATHLSLSGTPLSANDENMCVVCEEEQKRIVLLPCKHLCLCRGCSNLEKMVDCPMCRTKIEDKMEVFL